MPTITCQTTSRDINLKMSKGAYTVTKGIEYVVLADTKDQNEWEVMSTTPGLPEPGVTVSPEGFMVCRNLSGRQHPDNGFYWTFTAEFSSEVEENGFDNPGGNDPNAWIPVRETFLESYTEAELRSVNGKPYVNGAHTPFESVPEIQKDRIRWEFFQFDPITVTDEAIADANNTINNATYFGREKHTLLLKIKKSTVGFFYGARRRLTEYSITWNPDNWHVKLANIGYSFVRNGVKYPYRFKSAPNDQVLGVLGQRDVKFDENYNAQDGEPTYGMEEDDDPDDPTQQTWFAKENPNPADPKLHFIERQVYREANFSSMLRL